MTVIELSDLDAAQLAAQLSHTSRSARLMIDEGRVKVSIDRGVWTFGVGVESP